MTESIEFNWDYPGLDKRRFLALSSLLALRNGGQVEQSLEYDPASEEDIRAHHQWDTESVDTSRPDQIAKLDQSHLKRKLLDGLAELFANEKGGKTVACTSMREGEEELTIWVTRNEGFYDSDRVIWERLSLLLRSMASDSADPVHAEELWEKMLIYYASRLENFYIPGIRRSLKECRDLVFSTIDEGELATALQKLTELFALTFDEGNADLTTTERHNRLVTKTYEVEMTRAVRKLLWNSTYTTNKTKRLWENLYFLSRLRVILEVIKEAVSTLPGFTGATIVLVGGSSPHRETRQSNALSLGETIQLLGATLNTATVKDVLGSKWSIGRAQGRFAALQKEKPRIHAEVQMALNLLETNKLWDIFPYFGCSKKSCTMCWHFLQALSQIQTRGCHGRLFKPWMVPQTSGLGPGDEKTIVNALVELEVTLLGMLKGDWQKNIAHEKTSVVGGTSIFSVANSESKQRKKDIERWKLKLEQERVTAAFSRLSMEEARSKVENDSLPDRRDLDYLDQCYSCSASTSRRCSVCNRDFYCSEVCEEKRDSRHLFFCAKRPLTPADYLYRDVIADRMPTDEDVLTKFGFDWLPSPADKTKLLGLYQGLILYREVPVEEIHRWQVEGSLVANIKRVFFQIPESHRGGYFEWFLNHSDILDRPESSDQILEVGMPRLFEKARLYLGPEDQVKDPKDLQPAAKLEAYQLLALVLHAASPHPTQALWLKFGFCTCGGERGENQLCTLFTNLLTRYGPYEDILGDRMSNLKRRPNATFTEFWKAYENGRLIQLMDAKGYRDDRLSFPYLEGFLNREPSAPRESIWDLKQFVEINDPIEFEPIPAVQVDYGFMNCQTFEEKCILLEIYKRLLPRASPLDLHAACLAGDLFSFAQRFHKMEDSHRRLMKNGYPLPNGNPNWAGMSWEGPSIIRLKVDVS